MKYGYGEVMGKCKDCYGCSRQELPEFKGVFRCPNYIKYEKREENSDENI